MKNILLSITQLAGMQVVIALTGIVRNKILALKLEPVGFGEFTQIVTIVSIVYTLVSFGLSLGLSRNVAASKTPEERQKHLATANFIILAFTVISWVVFFPILLKENVVMSLGIKATSENIWAIGLLILMTPLEAIKNNYLAFLSGALDIKGIASGRSLAVIAGTVLSVPIVWFTGIIGAALQTLLLTALLAWILGKRCSYLGYKPLKVQWHKPSAVVLSTLGIASLASGFAQNSSEAVIRTELIRQVGVSQNAFYQAALVLAQQVKNIVLGSIGSYSMATLTQQYDRESMSKSANQLLSVVLPLATLSLGLLGMASYPLLFLLYSSSFTSATGYFPLLLGGDFLQVFVWVAGAPLLAFGHTKKWLGLELTYAGSRWLFVTLLLPDFGGIAVVIAYVLAMGLHLAANVYIYLKVFKLKLNAVHFVELGTGFCMVVLLSWLGGRHYPYPNIYVTYSIAVSIWLGYAAYKIHRELKWANIQQYFLFRGNSRNVD